MQNLKLIHLEAHLKSTLDWESGLKEAKAAIENGLKVLWKLDFGLFDRLHYPLSSQQQFQGLRLAIEHFHQMIWSQFSESSLGAILYEGPLDSIDSISTENLQAWVEERFERFYVTSYEKDPFLHALYCRDVALDYLKQLASQMPFGIDCYIQTKFTVEMSPLEQAIFYNEDCYRPLQLQNSSPPSSTQIGICLPAVTFYCPESHRQLDEIVERLKAQKLPYRFIAEESLIMNIEGLDELYVAPLGLSAQGQRKLEGFSAAGGEIHLL